MKRFSAILFAFGMLASFSASATECQFLPQDGDTSINDIGVPFTGSSEDGLIIPFGAIIFDDSNDSGSVNIDFFDGQPGLEESYFFAIANPSDVTIRHTGAPADSVGNLFQLVSPGNFAQIGGEEDDYNSDRHYRFEESLTPGIYCIQTTAWNDGEAKPWLGGSLEITVETQRIFVDTSFPACTVQAGAYDAGATRFADDFNTVFNEGKTVSNKIVAGSNIRLAPGSIEFAATTPPLNFVIQQVGQTTQTTVPSGDSIPLPQAGEYCIYLERPAADRLETDSISGSFSYTPTNDLYLDLLTTPSGTIDVAENQGTLQLPLSLASEQSVDTLVFVNLVVSEADANLDFNTSIFDTVVNIPAGSTSRELTVDIVNDTVIESDEQIRVSFRIPSLENEQTDFDTDTDFGFFGIDYSSSELELSTATITIRDDDTPSQENRAPRISISSVPTATVGQLIQFGVLGSDLDNDTLIYSYSGDASNWLSINESSGTLSGTPPTAGTFDNQTVTVTDTSGASANATFTVVVNPASVTPTTTTTNNGSSGGGGCSITAGANDSLFGWLLFAGIAGIYRRRRKA